MDLENIQRHLDKVMHERNNQPLPDFEGYSPHDMHQIIDFPFTLNSPIQIQHLEDADLKKIPMFNQVRYLAGLIAEKGELKLTNKGFLPTGIVAELYGQGFLRDEFIEMGLQKLYKEQDSHSVHLTKILIELSGLVKKRNGKLSLTKEGLKCLSDDNGLLRKIFLTFAKKFNWAYFDGYGQNHIGQLGYAYTLILLSKYGNEKRLDTFYADKYFIAYPKLLESLKPFYSTIERESTRCYSIRTFDRFLDYFGLIKIEEKGRYLDSTKHIINTELFDKLFKIRPHKKED